MEDEGIRALGWIIGVIEGCAVGKGRTGLAESENFGWAKIMIERSCFVDRRRKINFLMPDLQGEMALLLELVESSFRALSAVQSKAEVPPPEMRVRMEKGPQSWSEPRDSLLLVKAVKEKGTGEEVDQRHVIGEWELG